MITVSVFKAKDGTLHTRRDRAMKADARFLKELTQRRCRHDFKIRTWQPGDTIETYYRARRTIRLGTCKKCRYKTYEDQEIDVALKRCAPAKVNKVGPRTQAQVHIP